MILFAIDCKGEIYMGNQVKGHLFVSYIPKSNLGTGFRPLKMGWFRKHSEVYWVSPTDECWFSRFAWSCVLSCVCNSDGH